MNVSKTLAVIESMMSWLGPPVMKPLMIQLDAPSV